MLNKSLLLATVGVLFAGCIQSPLLNHANAGSSETSVSSRIENPECPLELAKLSLCALIQWTKVPADEESGEFTLKFFKKGDSPENGPFLDPGYAVAVKLWMPSMGHGSSPVNVAQHLDGEGRPVIGVFDATAVNFIMPGQWEIWVQLKQDKSVVDQAKIDYSL